MRKFTVASQQSDSDSGRFSGGAASANSSFRTQETKPPLYILVHVAALDRSIYLSVAKEALVCHVKQKLLEQFGDLLNDALNFGFFLPAMNGRNGKFLEEDRLVSAYVTSETTAALEFIYKKRINTGSAHTLTQHDMIKHHLPQSFLRYVTRGDTKKVEKLLANGLDPNFVCQRSGESPLAIAAMRSKPSALIGILIEGGAHKDFRSRGGITPLHKAAAIGNFEAVKSLLDFGQSPNSLDANGLTPLYHNILGDVDTRICHRLLYEHAQIGIEDVDGRQEIHQAAILGRTEQLNLLIMYGADVNVRSSPGRQTANRPALPVRTTKSPTRQQRIEVARAGQTPLHFAAIYGQSSAAVRLLAWGADPTIKNDDGRTPLEEARYHGNNSTAEAIRTFRGDGSQRSSCGPFLPAPTFNPRRKPTLAPLPAPRPDFVTIMDAGRERKGPSRSVTMPFPTVASASPSRIAVVRQSSTEAAPVGCCGTADSPSGSDQCSHRSSAARVRQKTRTTNLTNRASSEGDLLNPGRLSEQGRRRRNQRRCCRVVKQEDLGGPYKLQHSKITVLDTADASGRSARRTRQKHNLKSWKSSTALNDPFTTSSEDEGYPSPSRDRNHKALPPATLDLTDLSGSTTIGRHATMPIKTLHEEPREKCASRPQENLSWQGTPVPTNPFAVSSRPVSPASRAGHHFPHLRPSGTQSPTSSIERFSVYSKSDCSEGFTTASMSQRAWPRPSAGRVTPRPGSREYVSATQEASVTEGVRRVRLCKAYLPDAPRIPTFGLSLRTVKNASAVEQFVPTPAKPSLQFIKHVKPDSPAAEAGLRQGDFVIKINDHDVTRARHDEVIGLIDSLRSDTVLLDIVRPAVPQVCSIPQDTLDSYVHSGGGGGMQPPSTATYASKPEARMFQPVQRSASIAGRVPRSTTPVTPTTATNGQSSFYGKSVCRQKENTSSSSADGSHSYSFDSSGTRCTSPDEGIFSQSTGRSSSVFSGPSPYSHLHIPNPPLVHSVTDYRIRTQHANTARHHHQETGRTPPLPLRVGPRGLPKSNTVAFSEDVAVDTISLHSFASTTALKNSASRRQTAAALTGRSDPRVLPGSNQPQPRFLPRYSSPHSAGFVSPGVSSQSSSHRRRERSLVKQHQQQAYQHHRYEPGSVNMTPYSRRPVSLGYALSNDMDASAGRRQQHADWMIPGQPLSYSTTPCDPDLVVPPPEEFCC